MRCLAESRLMPPDGLEAMWWGCCWHQKTCAQALKGVTLLWSGGEGGGLLSSKPDHALTWYAAPKQAQCHLKESTWEDLLLAGVQGAVHDSAAATVGELPGGTCLSFSQAMMPLWLPCYICSHLGGGELGGGGGL